MNTVIIHTAKVVTELQGLTSCGEARRVIERHLTPEQRERVLAQEARWEAFERHAWEGEDEDEPEPDCDTCEREDGCEGCPLFEDDWGEDMDGDHASALASAGWGTDEDYGCFDGGCDEW